MRSKDVVLGEEYGIRHPMATYPSPIRRARIVAMDGSYHVTVEWIDDHPGKGTKVSNSEIVCPWPEADELMRQESIQDVVLRDRDDYEVSITEAARVLDVPRTRFEHMLTVSTFRRVVGYRTRRNYNPTVNYRALVRWRDDPARTTERAAREAREEAERVAKLRAETEAANLNADPGDWQSKEMLTIEEVAAILRISKAAATAALERGEIPGAERFGRTWRVARRRLEGLLTVGPDHPRFTKGEGLDLLARALTVFHMAQLDLELAVTRAVELGASWADLGRVFGISEEQAERWYKSTVHSRLNSVLWPTRKRLDVASEDVKEPTSKATIKDEATGQALPLLLTKTEAAKLLKVSRAVIQQLIDSEAIATFSGLGGRERIVTSSLLRRLEAL